MSYWWVYCVVPTAPLKNRKMDLDDTIHCMLKAKQSKTWGKVFLSWKIVYFVFSQKRTFSQSWLGKHFFAFIKVVYQDSIKLNIGNSQFGLFYTQSHLLVSRSGEKSILGVYEAERKDISTIWEGVRYSRWQISDCGVSAESPPCDCTSISGMDICEIL